MVLKCAKCGCGKFIFTSGQKRYGGHYGAVCADCIRPLTLSDTPYYKILAGGDVTQEGRLTSLHQVNNECWTSSGERLIESKRKG